MKISYGMVFAEFWVSERQAGLKKAMRLNFK